MGGARYAGSPASSANRSWPRAARPERRFERWQRRHQIGASLLSLWRQRDAQARVLKSSGFAAVRVSASAPPVPGVIEIDLDQRCVRVHGCVDAQMLREVLAAAR